MRKVFLDCGANDGCSVRKFIAERNDYLDFEVYSFEPNKSLNYCFEEFRKKLKSNFNLFNLAVSDNNSFTIFYDNPDYNVAGTINEFKGQQSLEGSMGHVPDKIFQKKVKCLRISEWIKENFSTEDYIILKLDVEGSEYEVIPDLLETGAIEYINSLYIEWHPYWCNKESSLGECYERKILEKFGIIMKPWDAQSYSLKNLN